MLVNMNQSLFIRFRFTWRILHWNIFLNTLAHTPTHSPILKFVYTPNKCKIVVLCDCVVTLLLEMFFFLLPFTIHCHLYVTVFLAFIRFRFFLSSFSQLFILLCWSFCVHNSVSMNPSAHAQTENVAFEFHKLLSSNLSHSVCACSCMCVCVV